MAAMAAYSVTTNSESAGAGNYLVTCSSTFAMEKINTHTLADCISRIVDYDD